MKKKLSKILYVCLIATMFLSINQFAIANKNLKDDLDPLVDIEVTVEILTIRSFDKEDLQVRSVEYIDCDSNPDFYIKVLINNEEFVSDIWDEMKYIYNPQFSATYNVPDEEEFVDIQIQLWDYNSDGDVLCDINGEEDKYDVNLVYSLKTGHWTGDDFLSIDDPSGYGRLNGCDDGSIYRRDRDCEIWFDIYQNDYDNDKIPYWTEVNEYGTDPENDDSGDDSDSDNIPIEWEWKWGYDPFYTDDHENIDPEFDSINNYEEYLTRDLFSDPFRKDLFIELDQMMDSPSGEKSLMPEGSKELLNTAYNRQNVVYHLDDGSWNQTGSDMIPFDELTGWNELDSIYYQHFVPNAGWKLGVFHYGVIVYQYESVNGCMFNRNAFQISSNGLEQKSASPFLDRDNVYASAYMHETGHTLGFFWPLPGHNRWSIYPWQIGWWINRPYKSCMNYGYMFTTVDYSDGSRWFRDYDDWERMDLTFFETGWD